MNVCKKQCLFHTINYEIWKDTERIKQYQETQVTSLIAPQGTVIRLPSQEDTTKEDTIYVYHSNDNIDHTFFLLRGLGCSSYSSPNTGGSKNSFSVSSSSVAAYI